MPAAFFAFKEKFHFVLAFADGADMSQRRDNPAPQQPSAHRRQRLIDDIQAFCDAPRSGRLRQQDPDDQAYWHPSGDNRSSHRCEASARTWVGRIGYFPDSARRRRPPTARMFYFPNRILEARRCQKVFSSRSSAIGPREKSDGGSSATAMPDFFKAGRARRCFRESKAASTTSDGPEPHDISSHAFVDGHGSRRFPWR